MKVNSSKNYESISISQFTFIIFGAMVGIGVLSLPNGVVKVSHQNAWISTLMGAWYPTFVLIAANIIAKRNPNDNIVRLNKKYFGKYFGFIINLSIFAYYLFFSTMIAAYYTSLIRTFSLGFLTPFKMFLVIFLLVVYSVSKGAKSIGIISEITFYITIMLILSPISALKVGNLSNLAPISDASIKELLKGVWQSNFAYTGAEISLIIYPLLKDKSKMAASSVLNVVMVALIYLWVVFITIFYLGPDIIGNSYWSLLTVTDSVTITVINNFRYIFIFLWSLVALRSSTVYLYGGFCVLKEYISEKKLRKVYFAIYPLLIYISLKYGNEVVRQSVSNLGTQIFIVFYIVYITVITLVVFLKERDKH